MEHFRYIYDLPMFDLMEEFLMLSDMKIIDPKYTKEKEICLLSTKQNSDDILEGAGSLNIDWKNAKIINLEGGVQKTIAPRFKNPKKEEDFKYLCKQFQGTLFEDVFNALKEKYNLGRIKIFRSTRNTCLSWHRDNSDRLHFPLKTQNGCYMIIGNEVLHLKQNKWYWAETTIPHTAINASHEDRFHLVVSVLENKNTFKDLKSPIWDKKQARQPASAV